MASETYIRFVTERRHSPYGHRTGIFQEAYRLWHADTLAVAHRAEIRALLDWFNDNLERPERLAASPRAHASKTAISWLRASAHHHLVRLHRLTDLVKEASIAVDELQTTRPGYIVYRDAYQVIALPFADTPR
jgi:hypothetical protein